MPSILLDFLSVLLKYDLLVFASSFVLLFVLVHLKYAKRIKSWVSVLGIFLIVMVSYNLAAFKAVNVYEEKICELLELPKYACQIHVEKTVGKYRLKDESSYPGKIMISIKKERYLLTEYSLQKKDFISDNKLPEKMFFGLPFHEESNYFGLDFAEIYLIVEQNLPQLKQQVKTFLDSTEPPLKPEAKAFENPVIDTQIYYFEEVLFFLNNYYVLFLIISMALSFYPTKRGEGIRFDLWGLIVFLLALGNSIYVKHIVYPKMCETIGLEKSNCSVFDGQSERDGSVIKIRTTRESTGSSVLLVKENKIGDRRLGQVEEISINIPAAIISDNALDMFLGKQSEIKKIVQDFQKNDPIQQERRQIKITPAEDTK